MSSPTQNLSGVEVGAVAAKHHRSNAHKQRMTLTVDQMTQL
jgi:hypothetical protein